MSGGFFSRKFGNHEVLEEERSRPEGLYLLFPVTTVICRVLHREPSQIFTFPIGIAKRNFMKQLLGLLVYISCAFDLAAAGNLHLIDSTPDGFALYRSGLPSSNDIREWCRLGISEVMVLSGDADTVENQMAPGICPTLRVVHHVHQTDVEPLSEEFLKTFDTWVDDARREHKHILFRCQCGCHRTGRLAAYYELKYMHHSMDTAVENLMKFGKDMGQHRRLVPQIAALDDYIHGRACRFEKKQHAPHYCVKR